jgi:ribose/xylose/arabinose/galactoside ABC-type transport system permease subunit
VSQAKSKRGILAVTGELVRRREAFVGGLLGATFVGAAIINPAFASPENVVEMLRQCAPAIIVACGLTFVIVLGEIDISVGALTGLLAAMMGILASSQRLGLPTEVAVALTLAVGVGIGLFNGLLVTLGGVPSILVTLGMLSALRGVTELLMDGRWITDLPAGLRTLGTGTWLGVPLSVWVAVLCVALSIWITQRTPLGRRLYAIGSNPDAARLAGLPIGPIKLFAFAFTGLLTAVAALTSVPQLSVIESGMGTGFELFVVTAVVVGGTSIRGGVGTIAGTVLAVMLLGIVRSVLLFSKLGDMATYWERAIQGLFILGAVLADPAGAGIFLRGMRRIGGARRAVVP